MADYRIEVVRGAAVVKAEQSVHFTAASPEVPGQYVVTVVEEGPRHAFDIRSSAVPFEAVRQNHEFIVYRVPQPVEVEEVAVGSVDAFALAGGEINTP